MSTTPLHRAAAVVLLSVLALGGSAVAAQADPAPVPPTVAACSVVATGPTYTSVDGDDIEWTLSEGSVGELVEGGLRVSTDGGQVAFTDYGITPFKLMYAGTPSLDYTHESGSHPGLTLSYALPGEEWSGTLVHEAEADGDDQWWSTRAQGTYVRGDRFTLDEWLAQMPMTKVVGVGFSLGSGATGAGTVHGFTAGCTSYAFDVEDTPTPSPSPSVTATPTPSATPTPTATPTQDPEPAAVPVPTLDVVQPTCKGTTVQTDGRIVIKPAPSVVWAVVVAGSTGDEDYVAESQDAGEKGDITVAPGTYEVWALAVDGEFGELGEWRTKEYFIARTVTVKAFTGDCPAVVPTPTWTAAATDLTPATQGGFTTAARVNQGGTLVLTGLTAGLQVQSFLFSVPTDLGIATVASDGTLRLAVPTAATVGTHRVAVYATDGRLVGWQYVEVLAAGESLAATGVDPRAGALAAVVLVAAGGALVAARRRLSAR